MKKKRKIFPTPEAYEEWKARGDAIQLDLRRHIERAKAELAEAAKRKSA